MNLLEENTYSPKPKPFKSPGVDPEELDDESLEEVREIFEGRHTLMSYLMDDEPEPKNVPMTDSGLPEDGGGPTLDVEFPPKPHAAADSEILLDWTKECNQLIVDAIPAGYLLSHTDYKVSHWATIRVRKAVDNS